MPLKASSAYTAPAVLSSCLSSRVRSVTLKMRSRPEVGSGSSGLAKAVQIGRAHV